jgi:putative transposase
MPTLLVDGGFFSRGVEPEEWQSKSRATKGERGKWSRCCWEYTILDETDFARHCDDIHYNPVNHGHVDAILADSR